MAVTLTTGETIMQGFYEVDSSVADHIASGDFKAARAAVLDPDCVLDRNDRDEFLAIIKEAEQKANSGTAVS